MIGVSPLEIRDFLSLNELNEFLEKEIAWYENIFKEYGERLGSLLREQGLSSEEIEKILQEGGLTRRATGGKGKKGKNPTSEGWFNYKGLLFSADKQGKAEILFESMENAEKILNRMKEVRTLIEELQKTGFGHGLSFSVYLVDGIPEKIFVQKAKGNTRRYKLELFLSTSMEPTVSSSTNTKVEESLKDEGEEQSGEDSGKEDYAERTEEENKSEDDSEE